MYNVFTWTLFRATRLKILPIRITGRFSAWEKSRSLVHLEIPDIYSSIKERGFITLIPLKPETFNKCLSPLMMTLLLPEIAQAKKIYHHQDLN